MLSPTRKTLTLICAVVLVIVAVPSFFVHPAETILFQPAPYQQQLVKQNIYARLPFWLATITVTNGSTTDQNALALMGKDALQSLYVQVLTPAWVKMQVDGMIAQLWDYLNFKTAKLTLTVDLRQLKTKLSEKGPDSVEGRILRSWPACSLEQLLKLSSVLASGLINGSIPQDLPLCRPPDNLMPAADLFMQMAFRTFANTIPDQVDLIDYFKYSPNFDQQQATWVKVFNGYKAARWTGRVLPWIAFFFLVLVIALSAVSWRTSFTYSGFSLVGAGILGVATAVLLWALSTKVVDNLVLAMVTVPDEMLKAFILAFQHVFSLFLAWSAVQAVIVTAIGLAAIGIPRLIHHQN
ncbi:MAG: hypothetical protein ABSE06_05180 [Anaerolineaceae bacterium]